MMVDADSKDREKFNDRHIQKVIKESRMMVDADSKDREKFKDREQIESDKGKQNAGWCRQ